MTQLTLKQRYKRIIQLEVNEVSKAIIDRLIERGKLPNYNYINQNWRYYQTSSEKKQEHIEPWIQWITAHTGKTYAEHKIFRLSDASHLECPQIWETLEARGIKSCIVGSMNAVRGAAKSGLFFPDPWSKEGKTYPESLQPLWNLISRKVQKHATGAIKMNELGMALKTCLQFKLPFALYAKVARQLLRQKMDPLQKWRLVGLFDCFLFEIFKKLMQQKYGFYTLFLNSVAHYQHHFWRQFQPGLFAQGIMSPDCHATDDPITYGFELQDHILGQVVKLAHDPETLVIVASGFSQQPFITEEANGGMNYYRLIDQQGFARLLGLHGEAFPLMSRDWQFVCETQTELEKATKQLAGLHVNGKPLFNVSQNTANSLFIETAITAKLAPKAAIVTSSGEPIGLFNALFRCTSIKSGSHISAGSLWISEPRTLNEPSNDVVPLMELHSMVLNNFVG